MSASFNGAITSIVLVLCLLFTFYRSTLVYLLALLLFIKLYFSDLGSLWKLLSFSWTVFFHSKIVCGMGMFWTWKLCTHTKISHSCYTNFYENFTPLSRYTYKDLLYRMVWFLDLLTVLHPFGYYFLTLTPNVVIAEFY